MNEEIKNLLYDIRYAVDEFEDRIEISTEIRDFLLDLSADERVPEEIQEKAKKLFVDC